MDDRNNPAKLYDALNEKGLAWHKRGYSGHENLSAEQVEEALRIYGNYDVKDASAYRYLENLRAAKNGFDAQAKMEEYQAAMLESYQAMAEYQKMAAEAAAYQAPYQQPIAKAGDAYGEAAADTQNRQLMRRGLLSLTRFGGGYGEQRLGVA